MTFDRAKIECSIITIGTKKDDPGFDKQLELVKYSITLEQEIMNIYQIFSQLEESSRLLFLDINKYLIQEIYFATLSYPFVWNR